MKNLLTLLLMLLAAKLPAQGLDSPWWGPRASMTFSNLASEYYSTDYLTSFNVGCAYAHPVSNSIPIYIEAGLYFRESGARDNGFLAESGRHSRLISHDLLLPLLVGCSVKLTPRWAVQGSAGLFYSVALDGSFKIGDKEFNPYRLELLQTLRDSKPKRQQLLQRSDLGVRIGVSATYLRYLFGFTLDKGVLNRYSPQLRDVGYQALSTCFAIQIGYNF